MSDKLRPLILITNDDGISSHGIAELVQCAKSYGEVWVVAPDKSYSGQSHSFTVQLPLLVSEKNIDGAEAAFAVGGSPVDCVKLAFFSLLPRTPDLVLSGINHGSNTSASVHYSGTLGAAREAAMLGVRAIGFSLADFSPHAEFGAVRQTISNVIDTILSSDIQKDVFYNVNFPMGEVKGLRACRVASGFWQEKATSHVDPFGQKRFWIEGTFVNRDYLATDTDEYFLSQGYATISPCTLETTSFEHLSFVEQIIK